MLISENFINVEDRNLINKISDNGKEINIEKEIHENAEKIVRMKLKKYLENRK